MIRRIKSVSIQVLAAASALAMLGACGSAEKKRQPEEQAQTPALGSEQTKETEATVRRQKQVTRTVEVEENVPTITTVSEKVDLNRADQSDLVAIGVPSDVAQSIIQYREEQGRFTSVDQLSEIEGMTPDLMSSIEPQVGISRTG